MADPTQSPPASGSLPAPDAEAQALSRRLADRIAADIGSAGGWIGFDRFMATVDIRNVRKAFDAHEVIHGVSVLIEDREFVVLVGPSGCGKSTFMKLATGLKMPSMGRILIDGQPVKGPLKVSGMAFQAPSLLPWRTTLDNVLLPLEIVEPYRSNFKQKRKEYEERARKFDYDMIMTGWGQSLSPGNEQRNYWGSQSVAQEGSKNYAGIGDPGVDALIDKVIFAPDHDSLRR